MNETIAVDQADEEILNDEVSDDALEAAACTKRSLKTLFHPTYPGSPCCDV